MENNTPDQSVLTHIQQLTEKKNSFMVKPILPTKTLKNCTL